MVYYRRHSQDSNYYYFFISDWIQMIWFKCQLQRINSVSLWYGLRTLCVPKIPLQGVSSNFIYDAFSKLPSFITSVAWIVVCRWSMIPHLRGKCRGHNSYSLISEALFPGSCPGLRLKDSSDLSFIRWTVYWTYSDPFRHNLSERNSSWACAPAVRIKDISSCLWSGQ